MTKTTYEVTGTTAYMGYQPGDTFEAELDPDQEERAVERGSIRVVKSAKKEKEDSDA